MSRRAARARQPIIWKVRVGRQRTTPGQSLSSPVRLSVRLSRGVCIRWAPGSVSQSVSGVLSSLFSPVDMTSSLWWCLGLLMLAVLSSPSHARSPAGHPRIANIDFPTLQQDDNDSLRRTKNDEDEFLNRDFWNHLRSTSSSKMLLQQWIQRAVLPCGNLGKCRQSTTRPSELNSFQHTQAEFLQPKYNHHENICSFPYLVRNIDIFRNCINKFSNIPTSSFATYSRNSFLIPQEGVLKSKIELNIDGKSTGYDIYGPKGSTHLESRADISISALFLNQNTYRHKRTSNDSPSNSQNNAQILQLTTSIKRNNGQSSVVGKIETSPSSYASIILELSPKIREGYKNNAFNDEDKGIIRRIFADIKMEINREDGNSNLRPLTDIPIYEENLSDIIDDTDYESTEAYEESLSTANVKVKRSNEVKEVIGTTPKGFIISRNNLRRARSPGSATGAEAAAVLALLAENDSHVVLEPENKDDDEEYDEYYDYEDDEEDDEDDENTSFNDDYENGSVKELIMLAEKHKQRKAKEEQ